MAKYNQEVECAWCGSTLSPGTEFCKFCNKLQPTGVAAEDASFDQIEKMQSRPEAGHPLTSIAFATHEPLSRGQALVWQLMLINIMPGLNVVC
ncbi:MAG: hypothetical protein EOP06_25265, partial [Proteobacteria bacterium]